MLETHTETAQKLSNGQSFAEETQANKQSSLDNIHEQEHSLDEIVEREKIEDTPFHIIGNKEKGYFLALGRYRLSSTYSTQDDVLTYLNQNMWDIIFTMIPTVMQGVEEWKRDSNKFKNGTGGHTGTI